MALTRIFRGDFTAAARTGGLVAGARPVFFMFAAIFLSASASIAQTPSTQPAGEGADRDIIESQAHNILPAIPPGDFQSFAAHSVGQILPVFGASFFETTLPSVTSGPVPADYIVGPGDEISLHVWGQQNFDLPLTINRNGEVFIPEVGSVFIAGMQYRQLHDYLKAQLGRIFLDFDLGVSMGQLRSIQIYIAGNAARTGVYTISSLSTMVNALFVSGGPLPHGSMRRVQLRRNGRTVTELDLYDLLLKGDKTGDARLQPEDVIYIPATGPQIAVAGSVKNPAIYEIKNEKTVGEIIEMAKGFSPTANRERATIERVRGGVSREIIELFLNDAGMSAPVADGDILQVRMISPRFDDTVTLRGNVADPGRFPWRPGMRLRDIIPDKESLVTRDYWRKRNQLGSVPAEEPQNDVFDINWSYAVIERLNPLNLLTNLIPFNPGRLILENDERENLELRSGDVVMIYSQADIRVPQMQQTRVVKMEGEFNSPGIYTVAPGETLVHLVEKAGGLTPQAYPFGAEFMRESTRRDQQSRLEDYITDLEQETESAAQNRLANAIDNTSIGLVTAEIENQKRTIARMRRLRSSGRIVLNLQPDNNDISRIAGLALEDGDVFIVPPRPSIINVIGEVYNPNSFIYDQNRRVEEYLTFAGGFTRNADKNRTYIIRADGSVLPKQNVKNFSMLRLNPGDSLVVPEHIFKTTFLRGLRDWAQVVSQFGLGAAAINVLRR